MKNLLILLFLLVSSLSYAQAPTCPDDGDGLLGCADPDCDDPIACANAIPCNNISTFYQVYNNPSSDGSIFGELDAVTGNFVSRNMDNDYEVNAIGYNVEDGFIYGIRRETDSLVKIGIDGVFENLGAVADLPDAISNNRIYDTGDFDLNGNLIVEGIKDTIDPDYPATLYSIDVSATPPVATAIPLSADEFIDTGDFTYLASTGLLYFLETGTGILHSVDPVTGDVVEMGKPSLVPGNSNSVYGAAFSDNNGQLYFYYNNNNSLYKVNPSDLSGTIRITNGSGFLNTNDGASCPLSFGLVLPSDGILCCDSTNLIVNGSFESGNVGFGSDYDNNAGGPAPGQYTITDETGASAACANWNVEDPTHCVNSENGNFMIVNGLTSQPSNTNNVIWEQTVDGLNIDSTYRFCAKVKNLPVCCFDDIPEIQIELSSGVALPWTAISTDAADPCDWQEVTFTVVATSTSETIQILLDHTDYNDGNDLALDDIGFMALAGQDLHITVTHDGLNNTVEASINAAGTADDELGPGCQYEWRVAEIVTEDPLTVTNEMISGAALWGLTTTFNGYNGSSPGDFEDGILYLVELRVFDCDCIADEFTFQYTQDESGNKMGKEALSKEELQQLMQQATEYLEAQYNGTTSGHPSSPTINKALKKTGNSELGTQQLMVSPNPTSDRITVKFLSIEEEGHLSITDVNGRILLEATKKADSETQDFDLSKFAPGVYLLHLNTEGGNFSKKIIKH